jgi:trans-aconitate methyltransferase
MNPLLAKRLSPESFEKQYANNSDPWNFAKSAYENDRYRTTLQALTQSHYGTVYEPGCSVGVLTAQLAPMATRVIAIDVSPTAVKEARARCDGFRNVEVLCRNVATYKPPIPLDLIVFSEIGYYFECDELVRIVSHLSRYLSVAGEFIAVHWLGESQDHVLHGDTVHDALMEHLPLKWVRGDRQEHFRLDVWGKS